MARIAASALHFVLYCVRRCLTCASNICSHGGMRWQGQELGVADAAALPGLEQPQRSRAVGDDTRVRRRDVPRGDVQERAQPRARRVGDAVRLDGEPVSGLHPCVLLLLRPRHARVPRPRRGARLRLADRRQDQRRRRARARSCGAARGSTIPSCSARTPIRTSAPRDATGSCPGSSSALTDSGTPFSILTKGTLLRRDLPLLQEAAASVRVSIAMSIAVFDDALQHSGRAGHTVGGGAARDRAGGDRGGLPGDGVPDADPAAPDRLDRRRSTTPCTRIKDAGAARVVYGALHLRPGAKQWFMQWLRARASRARLVVPRAVPGAVGDGAEGVPLVARQAGATADARARSRRPCRGRRRSPAQRRCSRARARGRRSSRPRADARRGAHGRPRDALLKLVRLRSGRICRGPMPTQCLQEVHGSVPGDGDAVHRTRRTAARGRRGAGRPRTRRALLHRRRVPVEGRGNRCDLRALAGRAGLRRERSSGDLPAARRQEGPRAS